MIKIRFRLVKFYSLIKIDKLYSSFDMSVVRDSVPFFQYFATFLVPLDSNPATLPLTQEYNCLVVGKYVKKYVKRREGVSEENHYRAYHLASDVLTGELGTAFLIAGVHGGGSPIMEDIAIMGSYDVKNKKQLAKTLAGVKD